MKKITFIILLFLINGCSTKNTSNLNVDDVNYNLTFEEYVDLLSKKNNLATYPDINDVP